MNSSSPSDSDSDREPNSHGARVFWGNLKTPEISRTNFVNPPKTVVKSKQPNLRRKSARLSLQMQDDNIVGNVNQENSIEDNNDETLTPPRLHQNLMREGEEYENVQDVQSPDFHNPSVDILDTPDAPTILQVLSPQSLLATLKARSSDAGSESEVEGDVVLQPPSSLDSLCALTDIPTNPDGSNDADRQLLQSPRSSQPRMQSPDIVINTVPSSPRPSEVPNLISFDMTTPTQSLLNDSLTPSLSQFSATPSNQSSSSSRATIDELLTLSPEIPKSPTPSKPLSPRDKAQVDESQFMSTPEAGSNNPNPQPPSLQPISSGSNLIGHPSVVQSSTPLKQMSLESNVMHVEPQADQVSVAPVIDNIVVQTPKKAAVVTLPPSSAQTRKRSPTKLLKGREKADDGSGSSGESSSNILSEPHDPPGQEDDDDKAAKKERRARVRQEAEERQRRQLMSLSPTSVDVLNLLASPSHRSPLQSTGPSGTGSIAAALDVDLPPPSVPAGPSTPARRIPILESSMKPPEGPPLYFIRPTPVPLDDPNRTPARRIPIMTSAPRALLRLPLDDPNRTPASRVPISSVKSPTSEVRAIGGSHVSSGSVSPTKSTNKASPHELPERLPDATTSSFFAASSTVSRVTKQLPFPIMRQSKDSNKDSSESSTRPVVTELTTKPPPASSLRQQSSVSGSKTTRVFSAKPYSRPLGSTQSRLPKPSSSRIPGPGIPSGVATSTNNAGSSGLNAPPATTVPTRIPSPVKRRPTSPNHSQPTSTPLFTPTTNEERLGTITTYRRKRQRMVTEDSDSDEPPAKRPMIIVRPVTKGMYNKAALADPSVSGPSTSQREVSPIRPTRPPGRLHIRPVIRGTLRHFETTRSSSRDLLKNTEEYARAAAEPGGSAAVIIESLSPSAEPSSPPPIESPLVDTDNASTVTTLSREPTLEDLPGSSSGVDSSSNALSEPGPELRRTTRVRKPCGPDTSANSISGRRREPIPLTRTTTLVQRGVPSSSRASSKSSTRGIDIVGLPTNPRQLQALTDANTVRNQAYLADLERKVVRKEGPRPASPTTKVRTIMEKSKEESAKDREARAERRRRRGEGSNMTASSDGDYMDVSSSPSQGPTSRPPPTKHTKGPGDEEEYETPMRISKPSRLDPSKPAKNVKWDRGLARTISDWAAEQAANRAQAAREEAAAEAFRKGCLARDPTTLHLDPLGNVPDAHVPLENLGHERVIVKRFVYDDDIEVARGAKKKKS